MNRNLLLLLAMIVLCTVVSAQSIDLEFLMPGTMFGPGSTFSLDLHALNTGPARNNAQLFVALTIGTGDFWFYPGWAHFPPDIDWQTVNVPAGMDATWLLLPAFPWPSGAGEFYGAMFLGAVIHNGILVSNLAEITFGWSQASQPTPTPSVPTPTPGGPTPTPGGPTPTPPSIAPIMVEIYSGTYMRGSPGVEACRNQWEGPQHQVTLTRDYYMMTTEVNRGLWASLKAVQPTLPADPSNTALSPTMDHPVNRAKWFEAVLFSNLLSLQNGYTRCYYKDQNFTIPVDASNYYDTNGVFFCNFNANGYRLPTEAEWEYAARAGTTSPHYQNEPHYYSDTCTDCDMNPPMNVLDSIAWWCANAGNPGDSGPRPVGLKLPNDWGLYDMLGNVFEWTWDRYDDYSGNSETNPTGPESGSNRVLRGGGYGGWPVSIRCASRWGYPVGYVRNDIGFRLVRRN